METGHDKNIEEMKNARNNMWKLTENEKKIQIKQMKKSHDAK